MDIAPLNIDVIIKHPRFSIYGEIHNQIDNESYKKVLSEFEEDEIVLCEHSTFKPFLDIEETAFAKNGFDSILKNVKGSEWIYVKRKSENKPVICIDVRAEHGFPLAIQEMQFSNNGLDDPELCLLFIRDVLQTAASKKETYAKYPQITEIYTQLIEEIKKSTSVIISFFKGDVDPEHVQIVFDKLCILLRRLCGLFVDVYIIDLLLSKIHVGPHISIFVGARHAGTLYRVIKNMENMEDIELFYVCKHH